MTRHASTQEHREKVWSLQTHEDTNKWWSCIYCHSHIHSKRQYNSHLLFCSLVNSRTNVFLSAIVISILNSMALMNNEMCFCLMCFLHNAMLESVPSSRTKKKIHKSSCVVIERTNQLIIISHNTGCSFKGLLKSHNFSLCRQPDGGVG